MVASRAMRRIIAVSGLVVVLSVLAFGCTGPVEPGPVSCGTTTCDGATQFCLHYWMDQVQGSDSYSCIALPNECLSSPTCACVEKAHSTPPSVILDCHSWSGGPENGVTETCVDGAVILCEGAA